jgi:uncharacterized protein YukE
MAQESGQILYKYQVMAQSAASIAKERDQLANYGKPFLTLLRDDLQTCHSDFTAWLADALKNMMDTKTDELVGALDQYGKALSAAGAEMQKLEEQIAAEMDLGANAK